MKIKRVLLTGDDGYDSPGTRLLIHLLRDRFELFIAGTRTQQSAVGGKITLANGFEWCETTVDGIPALCIDGTPGDATELVAAYFQNQEPFDVAISGVNWGANLGSAVFGSGTVNAALRALSVSIAQKAVSLSWDLPPKFYVQNHQKNSSIEPYCEYPGRAISKVLDLVFAKKFWEAALVNINFPTEATRKIRFTQPEMNAQNIYDYGLYNIQKNLGEKKRHFVYTNLRKYDTQLSKSSDAKALTDQYISLTLCKFNILDESAHKKRKEPLPEKI